MDGSWKHSDFKLKKKNHHHLVNSKENLPSEMKLVICLQTNIGYFSKTYAQLQITSYRVWAIMTQQKSTTPLQKCWGNFLAYVTPEVRLGNHKDPSCTIINSVSLGTEDSQLFTTFNCEYLSRAIWENYSFMRWAGSHCCVIGKNLLPLATEIKFIFPSPHQLMSMQYT